MNRNIEAERGRLLLSKEELSARLGISSKTYNHYVKGETPIPSDILLRMSTMFQCSVDYLLGVNEQNAQEQGKEG